jgi:hypothetical protein
VGDIALLPPAVIRKFSGANGKFSAIFPVAMEKCLRRMSGFSEQFMENGTLTVPVERFLKGLVPGKPLPDHAWRMSGGD